MINVKKCKIEGFFELQPDVFNDERGRFVKLFDTTEFLKYNLETQYIEEYYSTSIKNVVRGMHFQLPPLDHVKLVCCTYGDAFDVVLDLRVGSPTYGKCEVFELSASKANCIYMPKGVAHGFCVISDYVTMLYKVSSAHAPAHDAGILWSSLDIEWPCNNPILSQRDRSFISFEKFVSPFIYE
jgi:dTDP-4-dehydrorhamnose 3,5-epimerase